MHYVLKQFALSSCSVGSVLAAQEKGETEQASRCGEAEKLPVGWAEGEKGRV